MVTKVSNVANTWAKFKEEEKTVKNTIKDLTTDEEAKEKGTDVTQKEEDIVKIKDLDTSAKSITAEASNDIKNKVEAIDDKDKDSFTTEDEIKKKEDEATNMVSTVDEDWNDLIKEYNKYFKNDANEKDKNEYNEKTDYIETEIFNITYYTTSNAAKIAAGISLHSKIENTTEDFDKKRQAGLADNNETKKSIAEDKNKDPNINSYIDMKDNPFYDSAKDIFDIEDEEEAAV